MGPMPEHCILTSLFKFMRAGMTQFIFQTLFTMFHLLQSNFAKLL